MARFMCLNPAQTRTRPLPCAWWPVSPPPATKVTQGPLRYCQVSIIRSQKAHQSHVAQSAMALKIQPKCPHVVEVLAWVISRVIERERGREREREGGCFVPLCLCAFVLLCFVLCVFALFALCALRLCALCVLCVCFVCALCVSCVRPFESERKEGT